MAHDAQVGAEAGCDNIVVRSATTTLQHPSRHSEGQDEHGYGHGSRANPAAKRRSSQACRICRARKVRCDITVHGSPCTNCRLDDIDCVLVTSKRGPKSRNPESARRATSRAQQQRQAQRLRTSPELSTWQEQREQQQQREREAEAEVASITPISLSRDLVAAAMAEHERVPVLFAVSHSPAVSIHEAAVGLAFDYDEVHCDGNDDENASDSDDGPSRKMPSPHAAFGLAGASTSTYSPSSLDTIPSSCVLDATLPSFIHRLPKTLDEDDLAFLERKGAFTLPEAKIRDEILRCYVSTVHPFLPILDMNRFLVAVANGNQSDRISLLLFQAVMFAGVSALEPQLIERMGFSTPRHARQVFFTRTRLLHELEVESDAKCLLQALLLMSLWYGGQNEQRSTWYYTGLALSLAQNMGIHREPGDSHPEQHLRRRLWWSLYMRDRLIALPTRRPMRIQDDDHDVSMLSLHDFDCAPVDPTLTRFFDQSLFVQGTEQKSCLPLMCIELAKLCVCIGHVLNSQYTTLGRRSLWTKALMVVPKQDLEVSAVALELERCDHELTDWYQSLHPVVSKVARSSFADLSSYNVIQWHWTVLEMLRLTAVSLLHRPHGLRPFPTNAMSCNQSSTNLFRESRTRLKAAACDLTRLAQKMLHRDQVRFLPTSGVTALLSAALTHLLDFDAPEEDVRYASIHRFSQTVQVLRRLRNIYASADSSIVYLGMVIRKTGIGARVPDLAAMAREFSRATPTVKLKSTTMITTKSHVLQKERQSRLHDNWGRSFCLPGKVNAHVARLATTPTLESHQGHHNTTLQVRPGLRSAKMPNRAEFGEVGMPEGQAFGTSSLQAFNGDTTAVECLEREGAGERQGGELDQQRVIDHDSLFGTLGSLDYDIDPEMFNVQMSTCSDELLQLENFWNYR